MNRFRVAIFCCIIPAHAGIAFAQSTGTFIDRQRTTDLRVITYNVLWDTIFPTIDAIQAEKFARVVTALNPDVLNLQEIDSPFDPSTVFTAIDVRDLMNSISPLPGGATWYAHKGSDNVIVSKYPLSLQRTDTNPATGRGLAMALVDLPNERFTTDFYFMNNHYKCCGNPGGSEDAQRQRHSDALVNWMNDARNDGGLITLPTGTPMAVVGDLNIVGSLNPLNTLLTGDVSDEATYGSDSPPDWDGSGLADSHPLHNGVGPADYTWRDDFSDFDPGRLDFILYTDSVAPLVKKFILNTVEMSPAELAAAGLEQFDIAKDSVGETYDHLPSVVDFRLASAQLSGDYDFDGSVTPLDYSVWKSAFGTTNGAADGNANGTVDAADYSVWRDNLGAGAVGAGAIAAVPEPASAISLAIAVAWLACGRRRRPAAFVATKAAQWLSLRSDDKEVRQADEGTRRERCDHPDVESKHRHHRRDSN